MVDIMSCANTQARHKDILEDTFSALVKARLTLRPSEAQSGPKRVNYLGYEISRNGIRVGKNRIQVIADVEQPSTNLGLRAF